MQILFLFSNVFLSLKRRNDVIKIKNPLYYYKPYGIDFSISRLYLELQDLFCERDLFYSKNINGANKYNTQTI